jgi:hypothetical protein
MYHVVAFQRCKIDAENPKGNCGSRQENAPKDQLHRFIGT